MTAWAEIWASTLREELTRDALAGLESSWGLVVATSFSFFFVSLKVSARLWQGMALVLSSDSLHQEEGKASCPAWTQLRGEFLPPSSAYSTSACLHISSPFWWADDWQLPFTAAVSRNRAAELPAAQEVQAAQIGFSPSICVSVSVHKGCSRLWVGAGQFEWEVRRMQVLILTNIQNIYIVNMPTALQEIHTQTHKHTGIQKMGK